MAVGNFIPAVWSSKLLRKLEKNLVYAQAGVISRKWEGDIREFGDRVHIHGLGDVTIGTYTRNSTSISYEVQSDSRVTLIIDQSKYFAFKVDDLDAVQVYPDVDPPQVRRAAYQLAQVADAYVASLYPGILAGNIIAVSQMTAANIYSKFVDLAKRMDVGLCPPEGRFAVISPHVLSLLRQDNTFVTQAKPDVVLNGQVGQVAGISLLMSQNVPITGTPTDDHHIIAGVSDAWGYAEQIRNVETLRLESAFANGIRGLHLYGAKIVQPELLWDLQLSEA